MHFGRREWNLHKCTDDDIIVIIAIIMISSLLLKRIEWEITIKLF